VDRAPPGKPAGINRFIGRRDRESKIGEFDKALDEGNAKGWAVVDVKRDWKAVFPPAK
jgi:hypothetical protein